MQSDAYDYFSEPRKIEYSHHITDDLHYVLRIQYHAFDDVYQYKNVHNVFIIIMYGENGKPMFIFIAMDIISFVTIAHISGLRL